MAFPQTIVDARAELLLSGTWTDISAKSMSGPGASITRGIPDEGTAMQPSSLALTLNNADGRFSSRNPTGPYYGSLGRNTQIRVSVPEGASYLRLETDGFSFFSTADAAGLDILTSTEIQVDVTLDNWNSGQVLCSKWTASGNQRSWILVLNEDGTLTGQFSPDGTTIRTGTSTAAVPIPPLGRQAIKCTMDTTTGSIAFYTAPTIAGPFTQLGLFRGTGGASSIFNSTAPVRVGAPGTSASSDFPACTGVYGKVHAFKLLNGIGGTVVASPDFTVQAAGTTSFADAQGNTWSRTGTAEISDRKYRFHGEVAAWPQSWDASGRAVFASVTANGITRRLSQSAKPLKSAIRRYWAQTSNVPVAYWPMEDLTRADGFASGLPGGPRILTTDKKVSFAADSSSFACSDALPTLNGSVVTFRVPGYTSTGTIAVRFLMNLIATTPSVSLMVIKTNGTYQYSLSWDNTGDVAVQFYDQNGNFVQSTGDIIIGPGQYLLSLELTTSGGNVVPSLKAVSTSGAVTTSTGTSAAGTVGNVKSVITSSTFDPSVPGITGAYTMGHLAVQTAAGTFSDFTSPVAAWFGETAGNRFARLCSEEGIAFRGQGQLSASMPMGTQLPGRLTDLLQDCADADRGIMAEPRQVLGLGYRTRTSLYNQIAAVALTYSQLQAGGIEPTDDDQFTVNDVTVSLPGGSSARQVLATGALSVQQPPNGAGVYDTQVTLNLANSSDADDVAMWIAHTGTVNESRYPQLTLNLAHPALASLLTNLQETDLGDRYTVTGTPVWTTPDGISQLVRQYSEQFGGKTWTISWAGAPESPYEVVALDDAVLGRVDTDGSTLHSSATSTGQSLSVDSSGALWTTNLVAGWSFTVSGTPGDATHFIVTTAQAASISVGDIFLDTTNPTQAFKVTNVGVPFAGFVNISFSPSAGSNMNNPDVVTQSLGDFPFDWNIAGERVTVAKITGASSPQTANVVRSINGVVKAQSSGAAISLFFPAYLAM